MMYVIVLRWPGAEGDIVTAKIKAASFDIAKELAEEFYPNKEILAIYKAP